MDRYVLNKSVCILTKYDHEIEGIIIDSNPKYYTLKDDYDNITFIKKNCIQSMKIGKE